MMKRILTFATAALLAVTAWADVITLDLDKPVNPAVLEFADNGVWADAYGEDCMWLQFGDEAGAVNLSHLIGGTSWGGVYWDGFMPARGGDRNDYSEGADGKTWYTEFAGCMAGGGVRTDEAGVIVLNGDGTAQADADKAYIVGFWGFFGGEQTNQVRLARGGEERAFEPVGVYVCNAPWTYYTSQHGWLSSRAFVEGDHIDLNAVGVARDGSERTASVKLMDYSGGALKALNEWTYMDLSSLGEVTSVYFTVTSTDVGEYGINSANYFCLDKFQAREADAGVTAVAADRQAVSVKYVNLAGQQSDVPFSGMNIVTVTYSDGTVNTAKVMR